MRLFYFDTSALLKRYKTEPGTERIDELFSYVEPAWKRFMTSVYTIVEMTSAGERLVHAGTISQVAYDKMLKSFADETERFFHFVSMDNGLVLDAAELVKKYSLRPGDAIQLGSALRAQESVKGFDLSVAFVAADRILCQAAAQENLDVLDPVQTSAKKWKEALN